MAAMVRLVFQALEHPNVLKLLDFFEDERFYYLAAWPLGFEVAGFLVCCFFLMWCLGHDAGENCLQFSRGSWSCRGISEKVLKLRQGYETIAIGSIHGAAILMVLHGSHQYTPVMVAYIPAPLGSYGIWNHMDGHLFFSTWNAEKSLRWEPGREKSEWDQCTALHLKDFHLEP